jgi:L-iditol 2-dehydrogenase
MEADVEEIVFDGYRNGFDLTRLISHRFPIEESVEAIRVASTPTAASMKIFIHT